MPIRFFSEDTNFILKHPRKTSNWIKSVAKKEKTGIKEISYIFCSDTFLFSLNKGFLKHNTLTDIITFDYSSTDELEGEIYISVERVNENALKFKKEFDEELHRVIIHGILHLTGYKDKKYSDKVVMRKKEDTYLSLRK
jgi:probable rRNA maturation factor